MMYRNDKGTVTVNMLDAISWAENRAKAKSYGEFTSTLKPEAHKAILEEYCEVVLERQRIEKERLKAWKATSHKKTMEEPE